MPRQTSVEQEQLAPNKTNLQCTTGSISLRAGIPTAGTGPIWPVWSGTTYQYVYPQLEDRGQERGSAVTAERVEGYGIRNDRSTYVVGKTSAAGAVNIDGCFADGGNASASLRWLLLRPGSCLKRVSYSVWLLGSDRVDRRVQARQSVARVDVFGQIREGVERSFLGSYAAVHGFVLKARVGL
ncbi:uncharacterized protein N7518_002393 [Penicillium psychrosexuale]|uniref:uncharacterized protein n=1 Tax=Penicillium psychrosexuale TaxID=1002107 RepID=UPI002545AFD0|nr:uncharacterized protein N7518_002393 [Penicillium psychrosexuale]KAJ5800325.1 hypothetical protein N7518_002393 [Penicillium psychrosexuale]